MIKRHLALLFVGLLYGANYSIAKIATPEFIQPFGFIVIRVFSAGLIIWILSLRTNDPIDWKTDWKNFILCTLFGVGINMLSFFKGLSMTTAVNSSLIMTVTPLLVYGLSVVILKERPKALKITGLGLGLIGACLIIYRTDNQLSQGNWIGDLFIFINACTYGTYLVLVKSLLIKYQPVTVAKWIFLFGFIFVLPFGLSEIQEVQWRLLPFEAYLSMFYVVAGVTVIAYLINIWAMKKVNPGTVGAYIYVQPVFASFIAIFLFDEVFTLKHAIAALLVFTGVALVVFRPKEQKK